MELVTGFLDNLQVSHTTPSVDATDLDALFDEINRLTANEIVPDSGIRGAPTSRFNESPTMVRDPESGTDFVEHPSGVNLPNDADSLAERTNSMQWSGNDFADEEWSEIERVRQSLSQDEYRSMVEFMGEDEFQNAVLHYYADELVDELAKESLISQIDSEIPISGDKRQQLIQELKVKIEPFLTQSKKNDIMDAHQDVNRQMDGMRQSIGNIDRRNNRLSEGLNVAMQDSLEHYAQNFDKVDPYTELQVGKLMLDSNLVSNIDKVFRNMRLRPPQKQAMKYAALKQFFQNRDLKSQISRVGKDRMIEIWGEETYNDIDKLAYLLDRMPFNKPDDAIGFIKSGLTPNTHLNGALASVPNLLNTFGEGDADIGGLHILFSLIGNENARKILNKKGIMKELIGGLSGAEANKLRRWIYQHKGWVRKSLKESESEKDSQ